MTQPQLDNPLHGITLKRMLEELVERFGWEGMGRAMPMRCFINEPSIGSSLKFLRRTPWARAKLEAFYLSMISGTAERPVKTRNR